MAIGRGDEGYETLGRDKVTRRSAITLSHVGLLAWVVAVSVFFTP